MNQDKNSVEKEITLEDLALMVGKGFNKMDERFKGIDNRLDGIDNRLDGIDNRLDGIDNRLDGIDNQLNDIKADLNKKVDVFKYNDLTYRVEKLEDKSKKYDSLLPQAT
jgi:archaellum component FlaC